MIIETITLHDAEEAKAYLLSAGVVGPSLHPHVHTEGWHRWNGWNETFFIGINADGVWVSVDAHHYASGHHGYSSQVFGNMGGGGSLALKPEYGGVFPIEAMPLVTKINHPEHTPGVFEETPLFDALVRG